MSNLQTDVKALHILLSYMWEDVGEAEDGVVELNEEQVGELMDLINHISDQVKELQNV
jgi:hypothetical protein